MKVRITLITENNSPVEILGTNPEFKIKKGWEMLIKLASLESENGDTGYVENVEILE